MKHRVKLKRANPFRKTGRRGRQRTYFPQEKNRKKLLRPRLRPEFTNLRLPGWSGSSYTISASRRPETRTAVPRVRPRKRFLMASHAWSLASFSRSALNQSCVRRAPWNGSESVSSKKVSLRLDRAPKSGRRRSGEGGRFHSR